MTTPDEATAGDGALALDLEAVPAPDNEVEPPGFVVEVDQPDRIHFLDWGSSGDEASSPAEGDGRRWPRVLLIHGLSQTAWAWAPVARRLRPKRRVIAMDLRGHGLSDAPTHGYDATTLAADVLAVAEGGGILDPGRATGEAAPSDRIVLAGHGFGAIVAAWAAAAIGPACAGLVLVDGGWEDLRETTGVEPDEFLHTIEEPPEVLRSMGAFLADRRGFDPTTWDADQDRAARATVVEVPAGRVVSATRPHALAGCVEAMFSYRPGATLTAVTAPIVALMAADDEAGTRAAAFDAAQAELARAAHPRMALARFPSEGHNLMRYRPVDVAAAILAIGRA